MGFMSAYPKSDSLTHLFLRFDRLKDFLNLHDLHYQINPWFPVNIWNQPNDPNIYVYVYIHIYIYVYICIYSVFHGELPLFIVKSTSHHRGFLQDQVSELGFRKINAWPCPPTSLQMATCWERYQLGTSGVIKSDLQLVNHRSKEYNPIEITSYNW